MPIALYSPITLARAYDVLRWRFDGESEWSAASLDTTQYPALPLFLAALADALAPAGFAVRLLTADNAAGCRIALSHALPFSLDFPSDGCNACLGFLPQTYSPPAAIRTSPLSPSDCFIAPGLGDDSGPATGVTTAAASALGGQTSVRPLGGLRLRRLRFTALSAPKIERLALLWSEAAETGLALYYDPAFDPSLDFPHRQRLIALAPDLSAQSSWTPTRTWATPQPARYDIDLRFDER